MKLIRNNHGFTCTHCGKSVLPAKGPSRNHCPHCLFSMHVDNLPGDRAASCGYPMEPIAAMIQKRDKYKISFRCQGCGIRNNNIAASDDNMKLIADLVSQGNANPDIFSPDSK